MSKSNYQKKPGNYWGQPSSCGVPCTWWPPNGRIAIDLPQWWIEEEASNCTPKGVGRLGPNQIDYFEALRNAARVKVKERRNK